MNSSLKIKRENIISILFLLCECLGIGIFSIFIKNSNIQKIMISIGIMALLCMICSIYAVYRLNRKIENIFLLFILFAYLFSFGQCIMAIGGLELQNAVFSLSRGFFTSKEILDTSLFVFISIAVTCIGYCLSVDFVNSSFHNDSNMIKNCYKSKKHKIVKVGWILCVISIIPTLSLLCSDIITVSTFGYEASLVKVTGILKIFSLISGLFVSSILMLYTYEERHRTLVYTIIIGYFILQMAGGSRIEIFRLAVICLVISGMYRKELNRRKWIYIIVLGMVGIFALSLVSNIRNYIYLSDDIGELIKKAIQNLWENNFIVAAINEMGNTQLINTLVYTKCPSEVPYQYGLSFLKMIWGIIPNFIGSAYTGYIGVDITFSPLYTITSAGMGASYISEGYWNFGYFSIAYFILFGIFWGWIVKKFNEACKGKLLNPENIFVIIYVMYYMVFLVRSESLGFGRSFVYYALIPYLLCKINGKR